MRVLGSAWAGRGLWLLVALAAGAPAFAQTQKANPKDVAAIEACVKQARDKVQHGDACIGTIADPCLGSPEGKTTAGMVACYAREQLVWDDLLNAAYDQLRQKLERPQWSKLQDAQRAWLDTRKRSCELYWDFLRGTAATPVAESCYGRETAQRYLYLRFFVEGPARK